MNPDQIGALIIVGGLLLICLVATWVERRSERRRTAALARDCWGREVIGLDEPPRRIVAVARLDLAREEISIERIDMSDLDQLPTTDRSA